MNYYQDASLFDKVWAIVRLHVEIVVVCGGVVGGRGCWFLGNGEFSVPFTFTNKALIKYDAVRVLLY